MSHTSMGFIKDYESTSQWAETQHKKWMDSFGDEPEPELEEERIEGDDDNTEDVDDEK